MAVTARFYVASIARFAYDPDQVTVDLAPASKSEANKAWNTATPSGSIKLCIKNPSAAAWFAERFDAKADIAITFDDVPE